MSFPHFDRPVPNNGYAWWYIDGLSDDGKHGVTVIAFIGNVFSPYYHHARRHAGTAGRPAAHHCTVNVALYGATRRWAMTEYGHTDLALTADRYVLANNQLTWHGDRLVIDIDARGAPLPRTIQGQIVVTPKAMTPAALPLDLAGRHHWHPIAPDSRVEVTLTQPGLAWSGNGYLDHNRGERALEADFNSWEWARVSAGARTAIHYDTKERRGQSRHYALRIDADGGVSHVESAAWQPLAPTPIWRMPRNARSEDASKTRVRRTLEDTPFYSRSDITTQIDGHSASGVHESLSLTRFENPVVRYLLRCRMPRCAYRSRRTPR